MTHVLPRIAVLGSIICLAFVLPALPGEAREASPAEQRRQAMAKVKSWGYQLQRLDVPALAASPFDLVVIDHAPDRVESVELLFRRADIAPIKTKPDGSRRLVLAYLSIGEAERYRYYWDDTWLEPATRPAWLGPVNPQWIGNYLVEYWRPEWQSLMFGASDSYLDRVLDAGFDGIYLDRADVYEQFKDRPSAQADMVRFLTRLMDHARKIKPDAVVVLQNAEELWRNKDIRARVDGAAKESLYYNPDVGHPGAVGDAAPPGEHEASLADLKVARKAGRKVMVVEYLADPVKAQTARKKADKDGFLIHFAERSLSVLNVHAPDQQASAAPLTGLPIQ
jgi:cysteinyl-tRNA synthetase, unknown class